MNWYKRAQRYNNEYNNEYDDIPLEEDNLQSDYLPSQENLNIDREVVYHGGRRKFNINTDEIPSNGLFLSNDRQVAVANAMDISRYFKMKGLGADVSKIADDKIAVFYIDLKNPLVVDAGENSWLDIPIPEGMRDQVHESWETVDTDGIGELAKKNNYDGVVIKNVLEGKGASVVANTYIVFDKSSLIPIDNF